MAVKNKPLQIPTASDLAGQAAANEAQVREITTLSNRLLLKMQQAADLTATLEDVTKEIRRLQVIDIPAAMTAAGAKGVTLEDGTKVEVDDFITGYIKEENRESAHAWLRKNKLGSVIKRVIALQFGMGEDKKAANLVATLRKMKLPFEQKEAVHPSTLKALVRERLRAGKELPPSIDVTSVPTATVKPPKKEK